MNLIQDVLKEGISQLRECNIDSCIVDAQVLMMHTLNIDKITLLTTRDFISKENKNSFFDKISDRKKLKPISYITNKAYFMDYEFFVDERVLIPRSDTEILIEKINDYVIKNNYKTIMDIGTGSGCIPISLSLMTNCSAYAVDISLDALSVAKINAKNYNLNDKITFINSDLFQNVNNIKVDVLISNPPYINKKDMADLMKDVVDYEPYNALYGGIDGLDFYRSIVNESFNYINDNGMLFFEIGYDQGESVKTLMENKGFKDVKIIKDYKGFDRVVYGLK